MGQKKERSKGQIKLKMVCITNICDFCGRIRGRISYDPLKTRKREAGKNVKKKFRRDWMHSRWYGHRLKEKFSKGYKVTVLKIERT